MPLRRPAVAALLAAALLAAPSLTACAEDEAATSTAPVVVPDGPGDAGEVLPPGAPLPTVDEDVVTDADVVFMAGMIPHHQQAVRMAELAAERAEDSTVLGLASRIADTQGAEVDVFRRWLSDQGYGEDGRPLARRDGGHDAGHEEGHGGDHAGSMGAMDGAGMLGMATEADVARLEAASGTEFDRLWLELMTAHHAGALAMAERRARDGGANVRVGELAEDVVITQTDEINRMRGALESLPAS